MGTVTSDARQCPSAFLEARAFLEIGGLMPHVPGIGPIRRPIGEPMTGSTRSIQLCRRESLRILNRFPGLRDISRARRCHVSASGSVTHFAMHARFGDLNLMICRDRQGACGVALKAGLNGEARTLNPEGLAHRFVQCLRGEGFVFRGDIECARIRIVCERMLDVQLITGLTHECDRVSARTKSPVDRQSDQVLGVVALNLNALRGSDKPKMKIRRAFQRRDGSETPCHGMLRRAMQSLSMATGRLRLKLHGMA